jgi:hypothetical protein
LSLALTPEEVQEVREVAARANATVADRLPAFFAGTDYSDTPALTEAM